MTRSLFKRCGCTTPITGADGRTRWTTPGDTCPDRPAGRCVEHQPRHVVVLYRGAERDHATQHPDPTRRLSDMPRGRRGTVSNSVLLALAQRAENCRTRDPSPAKRARLKPRIGSPGTMNDPAPHLGIPGPVVDLDAFRAWRNDSHDSIIHEYGQVA